MFVLIPTVFIITAPILLTGAFYAIFPTTDIPLFMKESCILQEPNVTMETAATIMTNRTARTIPKPTWKPLYYRSFTARRMSGRCRGSWLPMTWNRENMRFFTLYLPNRILTAWFILTEAYILSRPIMPRERILLTPETTPIGFILPIPKQARREWQGAQDISTRILPSDGKKRCIIPRRKKNRQAPAAVLSISEITENTK